MTRIANGLAALGLSHGDRVLDLQTNSRHTSRPTWPSAPAASSGRPLNYRLHPTDWERIARDSGARGLVCAAHLELFADRRA